MTGFIRGLYLVSVISFLFISCGEDKRIPVVKDPYNNDQILFKNNEVIKHDDNSSSNSQNREYSFNIGNLTIVLEQEKLYNIEFYSRLEEENKSKVYFLQEELSSKFSEKELQQEFMGDVLFHSVVLDEDKYKKEFKNAGIESLELVSYDNGRSRKIEFDLLEEDEVNKKFVSYFYNTENVEGVEIKWISKEDNSNNASKYTIYLETSIKNTDLKKEDKQLDGSGINSIDEEEKTLDNRVISIMYRGSYMGEFNEENKNELIQEFTEILKTVGVIKNI